MAAKAKIPDHEHGDFDAAVRDASPWERALISIYDRTVEAARTSP